MTGGVPGYIIADNLETQQERAREKNKKQREADRAALRREDADD